MTFSHRDQGFGIWGSWAIGLVGLKEAQHYCYKLTWKFLMMIRLAITWFCLSALTISQITMWFHIYLSIIHRNKRMNETIIYILQLTLLTICGIKKSLSDTKCIVVNQSLVKMWGINRFIPTEYRSKHKWCYTVNVAPQPSWKINQQKMNWGV